MVLVCSCEKWKTNVANLSSAFANYVGIHGRSGEVEIFTYCPYCRLPFYEDKPDGFEAWFNRRCPDYAKGSDEWVICKAAWLASREALKEEKE